MKLVRTEKQFVKENFNEDLLRRTVSIAGLHKLPLWETHYSLDDFVMVEQFRGVRNGGTIHPWDDNYIKEGYVKEISSLTIYLKGFDTAAVIYSDGRVQGHYVKQEYSDDTEVVNFKIKGRNYAAQYIKWVNLLLEYDLSLIHI